ncbi:MAG TPA: glycosyltransferase family 2 protein, partial [Chloroflexota bacterium]|nr:glycosyltransferase family 2 protein [Chloroflexota bacterium]
MIRPFDDPEVVGVQGGYSSDQSELMPRLIQAEFEEMYRGFAAFPTIDAVRAFSAAFRRSVLIGADGFDPSFVVGDDLELSYRLKKRGGRLIFNPRARVYHLHGVSIWRYVERSLRAGLWALLIRARHPDRSADGRQNERPIPAEIPLAGLTFLSVVLGARWRRFLPVAGIFAAAFTTVVAPSAWRARASGADVALSVPGLRFLRSLALGSGMAIGQGTLVGNQVIFRLATVKRMLRWRRI